MSIKIVVKARVIWKFKSSSRLGELFQNFLYKTERPMNIFVIWSNITLAWKRGNLLDTSGDNHQFTFEVEHFKNQSQWEIVNSVEFKFDSDENEEISSIL